MRLCGENLRRDAIGFPGRRPMIKVELPFFLTVKDAMTLAAEAEPQSPPETHFRSAREPSPRWSG